MTRAEILWLAVRFAGRDDALPDDTVLPGDTIQAAIDGYRAAWAATGRPRQDRAFGRAVPAGSR
jgi:hypothetical protein